MFLELTLSYPARPITMKVKISEIWERILSKLNPPPVKLTVIESIPDRFAAYVPEEKTIFLARNITLPLTHPRKPQDIIASILLHELAHHIQVQEGKFEKGRGKKHHNKEMFNILIALVEKYFDGKIDDHLWEFETLDFQRWKEKYKKEVKHG